MRMYVCIYAYMYAYVCDRCNITYWLSSVNLNHPNTSPHMENTVLLGIIFCSFLSS